MFDDIGIFDRKLLSELDVLKRQVERQEPYIKDSILGDVENAHTYIHFIKTSVEVEKEMIAQKVKEKKRELESLKLQRK